VAASNLGYVQETWDQGASPAVTRLRFEQLPEAARISAQALGYTPGLWDAELGEAAL
jgi:hypothetical protein